MRQTPHRNPLNNQAGVAAIMMVVFTIIIMSAVGFSFFADSQQRHQAAAAAYTSNTALMMARAGLNYGEKCLHLNDANCPCNTGPPNDCTDFANLVDFPAQDFAGGQFTVTFTNPATCSIDMTSTGTYAGATRFLKKTTQNLAGGVVTTSNPQGAVVTTGGAIGVNNVQGTNATSNASTISLSYTTPVGLSDLVLVVVAGSIDKTGADTEPVSATFGGTPMIQVDGTYTSESPPNNDFEVGIGMFRLGVTANQTGTVTVNWPSSVNNRTLHIMTLSNTANVAPEATRIIPATPGTITGTGGATSDTITTLTDGAMVVTGGMHRDNRVVTGTSSSHTHTTQDQQTGNKSAGAMGSIAVATAGNVNFGFTATSITRMVQVGAAFVPSSGAVNLSYTVPAGSDQVLVVVAGGTATAGADAMPSTASFLSQPMTAVPSSQINNGGSGLGLGMFRKSVTAGDSGVITVVFGGFPTNKFIHAITLNGAVNTNPEAVEANVAPTTATTIVDDISTASIDPMIISGGIHGNASGLTVLGSGHSLADGQTGTLGGSALGTLAGGSPGTKSGIGWTINSGSPALSVLASFAPKPICS